MSKFTLTRQVPAYVTCVVEAASYEQALARISMGQGMQTITQIDYDSNDPCEWWGKDNAGNDCSCNKGKLFAGALAGSSSPVCTTAQLRTRVAFEKGQLKK